MLVKNKTKKQAKPRKKVKFEEAMEEDAEEVQDREYEDPYEDEIDSEQDAVLHSGSSIGEAEEWEEFHNLRLVDTPQGVQLMHDPNYQPMEESKSKEPKEVWSGDPKQLRKNEYLDFENEAYQLFYRTSVEWPCLSVDWILPTDVCVEYPYSVELVSGSQALNQDNKLYLMKWSELYPTQFDDKSESSLEGVSSGDESAAGNEPQLDYVEIQHKGTINRIRMNKEHHSAATWSDNGNIYIYNLASAYQKLQQIRGIAKAKKQLAGSFRIGHEGYGLCWGSNSTLYAGGEALYVMEYDGSEWRHSQTLTGHSAAVEDIQQSPTEPFAIATCSVDQSIKVWDIRTGQQDAALTIPNAHTSDVNVISWNTRETSQIASGSDDASFKIWDLRMPGQEIAGITWHSDSITSICWNPCDSTELALASSDDKLTVWDLSVEPEGNGEPGIPDQLLFTHQGQEDIKELIYHPNYELILSTAANSFNLFKPNIYLPDN